MKWFLCHCISIEDKAIFYNVPYLCIRVGREHPKVVELEFDLLPYYILRATNANWLRYLPQLTRWP